MDVPIEKNSLVFVGGMSWLPNLDAMVYFKDEIWPLLKTKLPDIKIAIAGEKPTKELADFSKRDPMFQVKGFVDDVRPFIAEAAVYVVPIRIGGGTRLKILDAMAMGKAIVSMSIGCEGIEADDGKDIIVADEPEDFANKIMALLTDEQRRQSIERNARENAINKYAWGKIGPHLEDVYYKLAKKEQQ
jgi:glycosyltransferase involved in cell wall biosynthesis